MKPEAVLAHPPVVLTAEQRRFFFDHGFLALPGFVPAAWVDRLRGAMNELLDRSLGDQLDGLSRMCMTVDEQDALAASPPDERIARFLSYWTAKEARMKLMGEGMSLEPQTISLELADGRPVGYLRPLAPEAELRFVPLAHPDAVCCLAVRRSEAA